MKEFLETLFKTFWLLGVSGAVAMFVFGGCYGAEMTEWGPVYVLLCALGAYIVKWVEERYE